MEKLVKWKNTVEQKNQLNGKNAQIEKSVKWKKLVEQKIQLKRKIQLNNRIGQTERKCLNLKKMVKDRKIG